MLSDLQKRKLTVLFRVMDQDGDDLIDWSDHERIATNIASFRSYAPDSEGYESVVGVFQQAWDAAIPYLVGRALTLERWLEYQEAILRSEDVYDSLVRRTAERIFDTFDVDGDGQISLSEWQAFLRCYGVDEAHVYECFLRFDLDRDGFVSRPELVRIVREFYLASDSDAAGNLLFGPLT